MGNKGKDPGIIYAPYIIMYSTPIIVEGTMYSQKRKVKLRRKKINHILLDILLKSKYKF